MQVEAVPDSAGVGVALVAAGAAVIASIVSLVAAVRTIRERNRVDAILERLRVSREDREKIRVKSDERQKQVLVELANQLSLIQRMRDLTFRILHAPPESLPAQEAVSSAKTIGSEALENFEKSIGYLNDEIGKVCHNAKNDIYGTYISIDMILKYKQYASEIDEADKTNLEIARQALGGTQNRLRDFHSSLLLKYLQNV